MTDTYQLIRPNSTLLASFLRWATFIPRMSYSGTLSLRTWLLLWTGTPSYVTLDWPSVFIRMRPHNQDVPFRPSSYRDFPMGLPMNQTNHSVRSPTVSTIQVRTHTRHKEATPIRGVVQRSTWLQRWSFVSLIIVPSISGRWESYCLSYLLAILLLSNLVPLMPNPPNQLDHFHCLSPTLFHLPPPLRPVLEFGGPHY